MLKAEDNFEVWFKARLKTMLKGMARLCCRICQGNVKALSRTLLKDTSRLVSYAVAKSKVILRLLQSQFKGYLNG